MEKNQFHVLAVDDNMIDRMVIERILLNSPSPSSSYRVTVVDSGKKALEFLGLIGEADADEDRDRRGHNGGVEVNLIMTDYSMPGMTGYELLRRIKEPSSYLKDVPVVMMSSENIPSRINMCLEDGADGFFLKPVKQSDVNGLIPQLLQINPTGSA